MSGGFKQQWRNQKISDEKDLYDLAETFRRSSDSFDKIIADGTRNEIDLASQYPFNPERHRLFLNGARQFPHYSSVAEFTDEPDLWRLQPGDGDTIRIESAESVTYTVQYVVQTSYAFELNQSLQTGDTLKIGPYNGTDGWYIRQTGSQSDTEIDVVRERAGTEKVLRSDVELSKPVTEWTRIEIIYNWYNVGEVVVIQTYIDENGEQRNDIIDNVGEDIRGPETGNLPLRQELDQDTGNTGTELLAGSMSAVTLGDTTELTRNKSQNKQITTSGTDNTWEPIYALKVDSSNFPNVNSQFTQLDILQYGKAADVEMLVVSVDPSKTDASNFTTPEFVHDYNNAILETTNVSQVPRTSDGSQVDLGSSEKPGGHSVASAALLDGGGGSEEVASASSAREVKKSILSSDVLVFCVRSSAIGGDIDFRWEISQNF